MRVALTMMDEMLVFYVATSPSLVATHANDCGFQRVSQSFVAEACLLFNPGLSWGEERQEVIVSVMTAVPVHLYHSGHRIKTA